MKYGTINCSCGQQFYFESANKGTSKIIGYDDNQESITNFYPQSIACIKCAKTHDISEYPEKVEEDQNGIEEEGV